MAGRPSIWAGPTGQSLILEAKPGLDAGSSLDDVIRSLRNRSPWAKWSQETLLRKYREARRRHGDCLADPQTTFLRELGISSEEARQLTNRLNALGTDAERRAYIGRLVEYVDHRRMWNRKRKAGFVSNAVHAMETKPQHLWPRLKEGSDKTEKMILAKVNEGLETKDDIVAATGLNPITVQNYLVSLSGTGDIDRIGFGRYVAAGNGLARHVPPAQAILNVLADREATPAEIRARAGLTKAQTAGSLHVLKKRGKVILTAYGKYALPGTAAPYVYAKDAIDEALQSGAKTVPDLIKVTGKNRGEIWAALRRKKAKGEVIQSYLIYPGRRGRLAAFASPSADSGRNRGISSGRNG